MSHLKKHITVEHLAKKGIHLADLIEKADSAGKTPEQVADEVVDAIASVTPWSALGPVGAIIDMAEAGIVKLIVRGIILATVKKKRAATPAAP